jgi:hypothetical protein
LPETKVAGRPAGAVAGATGLVKGVEKLVAQERMACDKRVPRPRLDGAKRVDDFQRRGVFLQEERRNVAISPSIIESN